MIRVKKNNRIVFLVLLINLFGIDTTAQQNKNTQKPEKFSAIHLTREDGLAWDGVNTMIRDIKGFLWVGSHYGGFCRFDGARFKQYFPDQNDRKTINSDKIISFAEDSLHNIWIGTDKGISRYDIKADTFTNFSSYIDSLPSPFGIAPLAPNKDEIYCIEPGALITVFNIHTLKRTKLVQLLKEDDLAIVFNTNHSFFDARTNSIWLLPTNNRASLQQIFPDGKTKYYSWPCYRNNVKHPRHNAEDMKYDPKRNSIWINSGDGLLEFSLNYKQFHHIDALNDLTNSKGYNRGVGIDIDVNGRIWLSTFFDGIFIYDPETNSVQPVFSNHELQKKAGDANLHIYCDRDGIAWTSNWLNDGLYQILPFNPPVTRFVANAKKKDSLSDQGIYNIISASNGELWIGTEDGLNILDTKTDKFQVLRDRDLPGLKGKLILPWYVDTVRRKAWISSYASIISNDVHLYEMDQRTRKCTPIVFRDGTKLFDTITSPSNHFSPYKNGLLIANEWHGIFEVRENSLFADLVIPFEKYTGIGRIVVVENRFLFTQGGGSFENQNGIWIKIPHLLDSLEWQAMFYNKKDRTYWVAFKYELAHYTKNFRKITTYRQEDGYNGMAFNMITDDAGNLWIKNNLHQINRLDPSVGVITTLSEIDGYQKQTHSWLTPIAKDGNGNLYFGGVNFGAKTNNGGLDRIRPERYSSAATSSVYLLSLTINQKPFPLSVGVNNLEQLSLRYNQNTISIETGIIDFYAYGKGHLRYKLISEGNKEDWQYAPAYFTIRYEKLPAGKYELVLQSSNAGNEYNGPKKILMITISPPFWQTWWFRILAAIVFIAIIYSIMQYRSRSLKQRNKELEEKVLHRTKELKHSLEDLRETQAQLIQSEKMASLGELTAGIAHEIQNPLNFVNNFSDVNTELISEMKDEIDKGNIEEVRAIANDIADNEQKINHHGKRADAIVKGMLQHSRSSSGVKEPTDINALADEYLRLAYHGFRAKDKSFNATMKTDFDESIGKLNVVPQDIGRVILNLITNAFYAAPLPREVGGKDPDYKHEPTVWVNTKKVDDKVLISVRDNGPGIPEKVLDKIFQPFFTTKPAGQGTGLGLSLAYDIVKAHGGDLKVETKEGEGAEFIILLPIIEKTFFI